jgi:hypothetical protein
MPNNGVLEEGVKAAGGIVDAMRSQPLALAMGLMNIALLLFLFYYLSRITSRTENTVQMLFTSQDKIFTQWGEVMRDTNTLAEKTMHCVLPEDAIRLMRADVVPSPPSIAPVPSPPDKPKAPE